MGSGQTLRLDERVVDLMQCPLTRSPLVQRGDYLYTRDVDSPRRYPIRDGIAVLTPEAGEAVGVEECRQAWDAADR